MNKKIFDKINKYKTTYKVYLNVFIILFIFSNIVFGEVLWDENFNSISDWQSDQDIDKGCIEGGSDITWWSNTCTTNCPPRNFLGKRF